MTIFSSASPAQHGLSPFMQRTPACAECFRQRVCNSQSRPHAHITHRTPQKAELFAKYVHDAPGCSCISREVRWTLYDCWIFPEIVDATGGENCAKHKFLDRHSLTESPHHVMCKSDQLTTSITSTDAELATAICQDPTRRALILTARRGNCLASSTSSIAEEDLPGSNERPQKADVLVFAEGATRRRGDQAAGSESQVDRRCGLGQRIPRHRLIRKGSRLNEVLVVNRIRLSWTRRRARALTAVVGLFGYLRSHGLSDHGMGEGGRRATRTCCSNAFAIIRNMTPGKARKLSSDQRRGASPALPLAADDGSLTGGRKHSLER